MGTQPAMGAAVAWIQHLAVQIPSSCLEKMGESSDFLCSALKDKSTSATKPTNLGRADNPQFTEILFCQPTTGLKLAIDN